MMSMGAILVVQPCSATGVPELAKRTLGEREKILEERNVLLIGRDVSSLVVDTLCKQAVDKSAVVACFYFDFAA